MTKFDLPDDPEAVHAVLLERITQHEKAICESQEGINRLHEENKRQDERLERIEKNTATLVDIFRAGDGTLKTAKWFGKLLIWVGSLSSALYALWYAIINWPHRGG